MKRSVIYDFGGPEQFRYEDAPKPEIAPGKLLIRVEACSVNPVDWKIRSGAARAALTDPLPVALGGDIAGVIEEVGEGVSGWSVGDEVFAEIGLWGGYVEYILLDAGIVARKPKNLDFVEAASLPLVALTALQGFNADGRDLAGLKVLVHNAAGGVGSVAVQIAKALGATVIGTASDKNADFVRGLGADQVVDFRVTPISEHARDIDILMDLVGNPDAMAIWALVKPKGSVIRIAGGADAPPEAEADGIRALKVRVAPDGPSLARIAGMAEEGKLKPEIAQTFPLSQAGAAQELNRAGHVRGKIVLKTGS